MVLVLHGLLTYVVTCIPLYSSLTPTYVMKLYQIGSILFTKMFTECGHEYSVYRMWSWIYVLLSCWLKDLLKLELCNMLLMCVQKYVYVLLYNKKKHINMILLLQSNQKHINMILLLQSNQFYPDVSLKVSWFDSSWQRDSNSIQYHLTICTYIILYLP